MLKYTTVNISFKQALHGPSVLKPSRHIQAALLRPRERPCCIYISVPLSAIHSGRCLYTVARRLPSPFAARGRVVAAFTQQADKSPTKSGQKIEDESRTSEGPASDEDAAYPEERPSKVRIASYVLLAGLALGPFYFVISELLPHRLSPTHLKNEVFDLLRSNHDIVNRYGEPLKAYGRDAGGRREGRRNFIEHKTYNAPDGTKRFRIRFTIQGAFGQAFVFAEVAKGMKHGEFMYLLIQDYDSGRVQTLIDNRGLYDALAKAQTPEEKEAIRALVGNQS